MGDPITTTLLVASTVAGTASSISAGNQAAAAAEFEAQQAREQMELAKLQSLDEEVRRRRDLEATVSRQRARAAAAGLDTGSGSVFALTELSKSEAEKDLRAIAIQGSAEARRFNLSAQQSKLEAKSSRVSGYLGAGQSLLSGGIKINASLKAPKTEK